MTIQLSFAPPPQDASTLGPVTLLGVIDLGDRMLFAGDGSVLIESGGLQIWQRRRKVYEHPHHNIAWGFSNHPGVGLPFKEWFEAQTFASWSDLVSSAALQLAHLNGLSRAMAGVAAAPPNATADVLMCGYIGDEGRMLELSDDGGAVDAEANPAFQGWGASHATYALETLRSADTELKLDDEARFRFVMTTATESVLGLHGPVDYIEVTGPGTV